ncbi:hypothetical protein B0T10DRAFT_566091 [Thelonectria olida]|uniref:Uncharacterized protein n=1 Tax=Thelonectria olida TaxID=1576542 RepID=A0A9P8VWW2_9HYPO|nr:hypothetical protein B0T10DRAFT_566091 [Thelonectria olida]
MASSVSCLVDEPERGVFVYAASKHESEKAIWKYYGKNKAKRPDLVVNTVLPNMNFGKTLDLEKQGYAPTSALVVGLYKGELHPYHSMAPLQYSINNSTTGRLHVAAAIHPDVKDERIFSFPRRYNWDAILAIFRKIFRRKTFIDDFEGGEDAKEILSRARAEQHLRDLGRPGWVSLEETVLHNVDDLVAAE